MSNKIITIQNAENDSNNRVIFTDIDIVSARNRYKLSIRPNELDYFANLATEVENGNKNNIVSELDYRLIKLYYRKVGDYEKAVEQWSKLADYNISVNNDVQAVHNSLTNIFTWTRGERILNPEFGSKLRQYLYNGITKDNIELIMAEIRMCITTWEPRVEIVDIYNVTSDTDKDDNTVHILIIYKIPKLSETLKFDFDLYYTRH